MSAPLTDKEKLEAIVALVGDTRMRHGQTMERYKRRAADARTKADREKWAFAQKQHHFAEIVCNTLLTQVMEVVESD